MKKKKTKGVLQDIPGVYEKGVIVAPLGSRVLLHLSLIDRNPDQPRKYFNRETIERMATTYKDEGDVDIPIAVSLSEDRKRATIVYGERRWRAGHFAGLSVISCFIQKEMAPIQLFKKSLRENVLKEAMSPIEEAMAYKRIVDEEGLTIEELATEYGQTKGVIYELFKYFKLHPALQKMVVRREIESGIAKRLTGYAPDKQLKLLEKVKKAVEEKGRPLNSTEATLVIRKAAEEIEANHYAGKGKKNKTFAGLLATTLYRGSVNLVKSANDFLKLNDEDILKLESPSANGVGEQVKYLQEKLREVSRRIEKLVG